MAGEGWVVGQCEGVVWGSRSDCSYSVGGCRWEVWYFTCIITFFQPRFVEKQHRLQHRLFSTRYASVSIYTLRSPILIDGTCSKHDTALALFSACGFGRSQYRHTLCAHSVFHSLRLLLQAFVYNIRSYRTFSYLSLKDGINGQYRWWKLFGEKRLILKAFIKTICYKN